MSDEVLLDALDYEKIMDFALLDPFSGDYYKKVLSLLKTNFTINLAAYTSWSQDDKLQSFFSIGFPDDFIRQAHNIYIYDQFHHLANEQLSSNTWNGIFYSQDTDPFTFGDSHTIAHLKAHHMHYFAIMILSRRPRANIVLCKTDKEGPFIPLEKEILQRLFNLLSHQAQIRQTNSINRQIQEIINSYCSKKKTGVIITDEAHIVLSYNDAALSMIPRKLNLKHIDEVAAYVFSLFGNDEEDDADWDEHEQTIITGGRCYGIDEIKLTDDEGRQTGYFLITIRKNEHFDNRVPPDVLAVYSLTERESDVVKLLVSGYSNDDIADQLHITIHTVKIHVANIFRKLHVHTRMEAIMKLTDYKK